MSGDNIKQDLLHAVKETSEPVISDDMHNSMNRAILAAIDRQDEIAACWEVMTDLMAPSDDLHTVNRDKLASAMYFLQNEYSKAREQLEAAIKQG